jgi:hypothetical protein
MSFPDQVIIRNIKYIAIIRYGKYSNYQYIINEPNQFIIINGIEYIRAIPLNQPRTIVNDEDGITLMIYYYDEL